MGPEVTDPGTPHEEELRAPGLDDQRPQGTQFPKEKKRRVPRALSRGRMFAHEGQK